MPCGWAPTSCCAPACRRTPRWTPRWSWCGWRRAAERPGSSTPCCVEVGERDEKAWVAAAGAGRGGGPAGHTAFAHAHPRWIAQSFADALGADGLSADAAAELDEALAADDARPAVHLLARPGEITAEELALVTGGTRPRTRPTACISSRAAATSASSTPSLRAWRRCRTRAASSWPSPSRGRRCSAPTPADGSIFARAPAASRCCSAAWLAIEGGELDAVEPSEHRADLVRRATDGLPVTVHTADGRQAPLPDAAYDRVLVDAPCTGLGALRRRPEARWRRRPDDVAALAKLQRELLTAALRHVRPGGVVAYVTCSPHLAETLGVLPGAAQAPREWSSLTPASCSPGCRSWGRARPCSSGRTATAPTRCSSLCCGAPPDFPTPVAASRGLVVVERRWVPRCAGSLPWRGVACPRASADRPKHAVRRLRPAGRGGRRRRRDTGGRRRLAARRRDGRALRAEPDPRPARGGVAARRRPPSRSTATS